MEANTQSEGPDKLDRIVEARMKLKRRFEEKMAQTPSMVDEKPRGSGPPNRHGMPTDRDHEMAGAGSGLSAEYSAR